MRTTVTFDDTLFEKATRLTGETSRAALLRSGLEALVARESAKRLALLGGTEPEIEDIPRRRSE